MQILYVEDNPADIDLLRRSLEKSALHITVDVVWTQKEALGLLRGPDFSRYDLVLTDMRLPDGDGIVILSTIRSHSLPVAVVVLTGQGDEETAVSVLKSGADDYVSKRAGHLNRLPLVLEQAVLRHRNSAAKRSNVIRVFYLEHNDADIDLTRRHFLRFLPHIEIEAALKASGRGWKAFPYYRHRYGTRGRRFSDSDTCWLTTLVSLDPGPLQGQVDWLCRVLAARGMPSVMLEQTQRFLHEELSRNVPERAGAYDKLRAAADILGEKRDRRLGRDAAESMAAEFEQKAGSKTAASWENTGILLVSAVIDEENGIEGAVEALAGWLTDPDRFPEKWTRAVR